MTLRLVLITAVLLALSACASEKRPQPAAAPPPRGASVAPGINDPYKDADPEKWAERFEVESREIYRERAKIVALLNLKPGEDIADIGSGTGLFVESFARAVQPEGVVYAVDITPEFLPHIKARAEKAGLANVATVLCTEDSVELPPGSIDVAFVCDTYHHFEYPARSLWSIQQALRPGGRMYVIDFERIEGRSRPFILEHVRAGREVFIQEIADAGFDVTVRPDATFLEENYVLECRKR